MSREHVTCGFVCGIVQCGALEIAKLVNIATITLVYGSYNMGVSTNIYIYIDVCLYIYLYIRMYIHMYIYIHTSYIPRKMSTGTLFWLTKNTTTPTQSTGGDAVHRDWAGWRTKCPC